MESEEYSEVIGRGEAFTATMGGLRFRIINNYPNILPSEGLSNYLDAPAIAYIGEVGSLAQITVPDGARWERQCEIIDNGGYVARVKWYDASDRTDRDGYIYLYVEKTGDFVPGQKPGEFNDEIRVTYKLAVR